MVAGTYAKGPEKKGKLPMSGSMAKKEKPVVICGCGKVNVPMHRGYCTECV